MPRSTSWSALASLGAVMRCAIIARDDCSCVHCGKELPVTSDDQRDAAQIDHLIPRRDGGKSLATNLVTSCWPCNRDRAAGRLALADSAWRAVRRPLDIEAGRRLAAIHYPDRMPRRAA